MNSLGWDIMMQAGAGWRGGGLLRAAHLLRNDHTSTSLPQNLHILSLMSDIKWSLFLSVHLTFTNPIIYHLFCSISSSTLSTLVYPPPQTGILCNPSFSRKDLGKVFNGLQQMAQSVLSFGATHFHRCLTHFSRPASLPNSIPAVIKVFWGQYRRLGHVINQWM